jgi:hypothetical protein
MIAVQQEQSTFSRLIFFPQQRKQCVVTENIVVVAVQLERSIFSRLSQYSVGLFHAVKQWKQCVPLLTLWLSLQNRSNQPSVDSFFVL